MTTGAVRAVAGGTRGTVDSGWKPELRDREAWRAVHAVAGGTRGTVASGWKPELRDRKAWRGGLRRQ